MPKPQSLWDHETDLLVFGAGMGGLCAALFGVLEGLDVLLCEKTDQVGGTTATSAGTVWIPDAAGDDAEEERRSAAAYLDAEIGNHGDRETRDAFLSTGRIALERLQQDTEVKFRRVAPHPDYHPHKPGWSGRGRALAALPFDGKLLGKDFALVRPPIAPFMVLGGLMVGRDDIPHFLKPFGSAKSFVHVAKLLVRHGMDRLRHRRGARLIMGNALVARLLYSLRQKGVPLWMQCRLVELIGSGGKIEGAIVETGGVRKRIRARRGVILATGGFSHSGALRAELLGVPATESVAHAGDTGDGIVAARTIGGDVAPSPRKAAFWMPASILEQDGRRTLFPHIVLDRAKPGLIAVNAAGHRFVNEADSYHDFVEGMFRSHASVPTIPAWLVCDRDFIRDYGIGLVHPASSDATIARFVRLGYLRRGDTLAQLAAALGIASGNLSGTLAAHNRFAETGIDEAFGKGSNALNRHNGDSANKPNPCLRPIARAPFFAVAVYPADLGTSAGLRTDKDARVLGRDGAAIAGLYACGNDQNSVMAGAYPGPGTTLGPALVFAYRAVTDAARR
jgi:3-oxosteroid 1-dehydrogenase